MGSSNWDASQYRSYSASVQNSSQQQIFTNTRGVHPDLDPSKFAVRESCDSAANPESTPIIIAVDETGSMGHLAVEIIKQGLGIIMENIIAKKPVSDPHLMLAAVGDAYCDDGPIQATQFEADTKLVQQIEKIFIEGNGGGNGGESYALVWWLAANKTKCDAFTKRQRKGYIFTVGDEACHRDIPGNRMKGLFGVEAPGDISASAILAECLKNWHVYHLITPTGATESQNAKAKWRELLGERAITITDWRKMAEVIVSIMQINEGQDRSAVIRAWDSGTQQIVAAAVKSLPGTGGDITVTEEI